MQLKQQQQQRREQMLDDASTTIFFPLQARCYAVGFKIRLRVEKFSITQKRQQAFQ